MGGRLSKPVAPDGISESPKTTTPRTPRRAFNSRMLVAPATAFIMAGIVLVYTRASIRAAKLGVEKRREADGGGRIDWGNEGRRMRGQLNDIDEQAVNNEGLIDSLMHPFGARKKGDKKD